MCGQNAAGVGKEVGKKGGGRVTQVFSVYIHTQLGLFADPGARGVALFRGWCMNGGCWENA